MKKPGYKTTEFWLSTAAALVGIAIASGAVNPDGGGAWDKITGMIVATLAAMGYSYSRASVKASGK
jgi:hypothetical protein